MKITTKKYAQALLEVIEGKNESEAKTIIARLLKIMIADKGLKDTDALIKNFIDLWNKQNDLSVVEVTTANKLTSTSKKMIKEYVADKLKTKEVELSEKIDKNILGGLVIREGDRIFDGSLRGRLYDLKERIS